MSKLNFEVRQKVIEIAGVCFWYWDNLYNFFESCGIKKSHYLKYDGESKYKMMRNILSDLEDKQDDKTLMAILTNLYNLKGLPDKNVPDEAKAKNALKEFKEICGNDIIENELKNRKAVEKARQNKENTEAVISSSKKLQDLNKEFLGLFTTDDKQKRGYDLERIVSDLFTLNEFEFHKPYKVKNEQIDGYFSYDKFYYLLEIKWVAGFVKQGDLAVFDKKIDKKAKSTRGLFIAMDGFDEEGILSISGKEPRILLMDGEDLSLILNGTVSLKDALKAKIDKLVKEGNTYFKVRELI
tara:strand:- start:46 stop:936 length:891 start_codon:yes stop_codon:yes gene_type:complete